MFFKLHKFFGKKFYLFSLCLLFINSILSEGFSKGTIVWVGKNQYKCIEDLKIGDPIISIDMVSQRLVKDRVRAIDAITTDEMITMYFDSDDVVGIDSVTMDIEQKLFCPDVNGWVEAGYLTKGYNLVSCLGLREIAGYTIHNKTNYAYRITLEKHPHFFVGKRHFLVHNYIQLLAFSVAFGGETTGGVLLSAIGAQLMASLGKAVIAAGIVGIGYLATEKVMDFDTAQLAVNITNYAATSDCNWGSTDTMMPGTAEYELQCQIDDFARKKIHWYNSSSSSSTPANSGSGDNPGNLNNNKRPDDDKDNEEKELTDDELLRLAKSDRADYLLRQYNSKLRRKDQWRKSGIGPKGEVVYTNGKRYISIDIDNHNGGIWKELDRYYDRKFTLDRFLNIIKK